jgi:hypothetical protein
MYAKVVKNQIEIAGNYIKLVDDWVSNPSEQQLIEAGFKSVRTEVVTDVVSRFSETETEIVIFNATSKVMSLTRADAKLKLVDFGLLDFVESEISQLPTTNPMRIYYENAQSFDRLNPYLIEFCKEKLQMTESQIDELFI